MNERPEIPLNIDHADYFDRLLKDRVNKSSIPKISGLNAIIRFVITDDENGVWDIAVEKGFVKEVAKVVQEKPACTFLLDSSTFLSVIKREITPQQAFFKGKVDIKGDILLALKMNILVEYL
ncbi:MAG: SCP2 sterol-binding domain-containing protein [Candidatus Brocadia sp.]|nr:SCP2 sterol-binding domain-containing protein [Candidatus Brocadia sp.]